MHIKFAQLGSASLHMVQLFVSDQIETNCKQVANYAELFRKDGQSWRTGYSQLNIRPVKICGQPLQRVSVACAELQLHILLTTTSPFPKITNPATG